jgi:hypothetical protein
MQEQILIDHIFFAVLTRNKDDAGTESPLNLTINIDGIDVYDKNHGLRGTGGWALGFGGYHDQGDADVTPPTLSHAQIEPFDLNALTNSSVRVGIRDDDAWAPQHVLLLGRADPSSKEKGRILALAVEVDQGHWLSTDREEGHLSMPLRLVGSGSGSTLIRRVLLLVYTWGGADVGTDENIELQIAAAGKGIVVSGIVPDSPTDDREEYVGNWYFLDVLVPFTRDEVLSGGGIKLKILGDDAWLPAMVFVYGFDVAEGRPTEIVHLSSVADWRDRDEFGWLSTDPSEGKSSYDLPVF